MRFPIYRTPEDKRAYRAECEAYDEDRWRDMVISIRDRTMTRDVYKQLCRSLRNLYRNLPREGLSILTIRQLE